MSNSSDDPITNQDTPPVTPDTNVPPVDPVEEKIKDALKDVKSKLDRVYAERDELAKKLAEKEQREREQEIERLKAEGKDREAFEMQLSQEKAEKEALRKKNIELTRDIELRDSLLGYTFKNDNAMKLARQEIVQELIQNEQGLWIHKSGVSIKDYVKVFSDNPANEFLFKAKANNGAGDLTTQQSSTTSSNTKSVFEMNQDDVMKLAREGKLRRRK
jgi:hypothetical protein